jgi:hypothetical protein
MPEWVLTENRSWNEQYVFRALLMFSNAFRVLFESMYALLRMPELIRRALGAPDAEPGWRESLDSSRREHPLGVPRPGDGCHALSC